MPPADVGGVLLVGVLAVVDEDVGVEREVVSRDPLGLDLVEDRAQGRLVVGYVADRRLTVGDPEAERRPTVVDRLAANRHRAELPLDRRRLAEGDRTGKLPDLDRRQGGRDVTSDPVLKRRLRRGRSPHGDLGVGAEARREEHQALDVVEVEVGEEDVDARRADQVQAQGPDPRARVENQLLAVSEVELDARGVAPVAVHLRSRRGYRAPGAPDLDPHPSAPEPVFASGAKKRIAPEDPSSDATIGKALDSITCSAPRDDRIRKTAWAARPLRIASVVVSSSSPNGLPSSPNGP